MYYRENGNIVKEDNSNLSGGGTNTSSRKQPTIENFGQKSLPFPMWLLLLIIAVLLAIACYLIWYYKYRNKDIVE